MTGTDDVGNTPAMAERLAAAIPGARCVLVPGLRHMGFAEDPAAFNGPIVEFLRTALPANGGSNP